MSRGLSFGRMRLGFNNSLCRVKRSVQKNAPTIGTIGGVIGVIAGAVGIGIASTKVNDILEEAKADVELIENYVEKKNDEAEASEEEPKYSEEEKKRSIRKVYSRTFVDLIKLYGIPVIIIFASLASILVSHKAMLDRTVQLSVAYSALLSSFNKYRQNVITDQGEDADKRYRYDIISQDIEAKEIDPETGKSKKVKSKLEYTQGDPSSDYVRVFDKSNPNWYDDPYDVQFFIKATQTRLNDQLRAVGFVFLNDALFELGFPKTAAGQIVGWTYDRDNPIGDNYIDFNVHETSRRDENGNFERVYMLEFNVDGTMFDKIERKKVNAA